MRLKKIMKKLNKLENVKIIKCEQCMEFHPIDENYFKATGIKEDIIKLIDCIIEEFKVAHSGHNIVIEDSVGGFPLDYKFFMIPSRFSMWEPSDEDIDFF